MQFSFLDIFFCPFAKKFDIVFDKTFLHLVLASSSIETTLLPLNSKAPIVAPATEGAVLILCVFISVVFIRDLPPWMML